MPQFWKKDEQFCVNITTGPTCVTLRLSFSDQRREDINITAEFAPSLQANVATAKLRILEGANAANRQYSTALFPCLATCSVDDYTSELPILRRAAFAIVERLAVSGESGFEHSP